MKKIQFFLKGENLFSQTYINNLNIDIFVLFFDVIVESESPGILGTTNIANVLEIVVGSLVALHMRPHRVQRAKRPIAFGARKWFCVAILVTRQLHRRFECFRAKWTFIVALLWMRQQMMIVYWLCFESVRKKNIFLNKKSYSNRFGNKVTIEYNDLVKKMGWSII